MDRIALRWVIFKRKKGFATISLGIIYQSIALSEPPSCDTVPLSCGLRSEYLALLPRLVPAACQLSLGEAGTLTHNYNNNNIIIYH
jgi:hypothetical protein